jgi:GTPase SAR1 family protein
MSQMNIGHILEDMPSVPAKISVLFRGDHGIGKSSLVRQLAKRIADREGIQDYIVVDRRLAQLTQGDIIGLPKIDGRSTKFIPPDWYVTACEKPCVLFLDELNRAEVEVMQAAFQIVLDRELNGHKLHPQTRVYAAVNTKANYNVNAIDPALLDRFFVIDVRFTKEEWVKWARENGIHEMIVDFINLNETWLLPPNKYDVNDVVTSPRSWERVNDIIHPLLVSGAETGNYNMDRIRRMIAGLCGNDAAMAFLEHLKAEFKFSGEDIMNRYTEIRSKIKRERVDVMVNAAEKLVAFGDTLETIDDRQAKNLEKFIWDLEKDHRVTLWQKMARLGNARLAFIRSIHNSVAPAICDAFGVPIGPKGIGILPNVHGAVQRADEEAKQDA